MRDNDAKCTIEVLISIECLGMPFYDHRKHFLILLLHGLFAAILCVHMMARVKCRTDIIISLLLMVHFRLSFK